MELLTKEEKLKILRTLKVDEEFRYAIAGLIGYSEVLEEIRKIWKNIEKIWEEIKDLKRDIKDLKNDIKNIKRNIENLERNQERLWREVKSLRIDQGKIWEETREIKRLHEKYSLTIEEEANQVVSYLLEKKGVAIETRPEYFNEEYEFDIYGTNGEITVIGEAKIRAGPSHVAKLNERVREAEKKWPQKLPGKIIKVLYCLRATPKTIEEAEKTGVWLIESMKEKTKPSL